MLLKNSWFSLSVLLLRPVVGTYLARSSQLHRKALVARQVATSRTGVGTYLASSFLGCLVVLSPVPLAKSQTSRISLFSRLANNYV